MTSPHVQDELTRYALGEVQGEELRRVQEHLGSCAECRRELNETLLVLGLTAMAQAERAVPSPAVRARLLRTIKEEQKSTPVRARWIWPIAWAAVTTVTVILGLENYSLRLQLKQTEHQIAAADPASEAVRALLLAPDAVRVTLRPASIAPQPQGRAVYVAHNSKLVFFGNDLESLPAGKAYELWLLPVEGNPVPAGTFKPNARGEATLLNPPLPSGLQAKGFAITVEPETGSAQPTSAILLVGTI